MQTSVVQPFLPRGTFDWRDVLATLAAGMLAAVLVTLVHFIFPERNGDSKRHETMNNHRRKEFSPSYVRKTLG